MRPNPEQGVHVLEHRQTDVGRQRVVPVSAHVGLAGRDVEVHHVADRITLLLVLRYEPFGVEPEGQRGAVGRALAVRRVVHPEHNL